VDEILTRHPPPKSLRDVVPEAIKSCARCGGPLINGWRISQYILPVCESCKVAICGEVVRHKPSATSITIQDPSKPHLPLDLVREWRERAKDTKKLSFSGQWSSYYRAISYTYNRCADELESNPAWKEAMKATYVQQ